MGVPGFFLWLMKNYKNGGFVFQKEKLVSIDIKTQTKGKTKTKQTIDITDQIQLEKAIRHNNIVEPIITEINSIDYFLIDANCLIHPVCFKTVADNPDLITNTMLEHKMLNNICEYLEKIINYVDPKKGVYLAIDGVAPVAKIKQQRMRRFKSVADKIMWDNIKKKHNKPLGNYWNNNAITPGTLFMEKLHNKLLEWSKTVSRPIIYSSCFTPSEGEHKLLQFVRNNQKNKLDYSYVIYGLDADLIFLALSTESNKIYLLREANEINKNESSQVLNYVSIKIMSQSIVNTIRGYLIETVDGLLNVDKLIDNDKPALYGFDNLDDTRVVNDFIFMCYFLGNDFLPHIPSLNIHHDGIPSLIISWAETINEIILEKNQIEYLLNDTAILRSNSPQILDKINNEFFIRFIHKLGLQEEGILRENFAKGKKRMGCDGDAYEKEVFKIENIQFKVEDPIKLGSDNPDEWRLRYYQHYWQINSEELEEFSEKLVMNYLMGIKWVTMYYFDTCPSWNWYYPFDHPPFISDIAKYSNKININTLTFELGESLKPYMQLLSVLPPQSSYLLPDNLGKLMTNPKSSLIYLYPQEFDQDFINKKKHWMGIPKLPPLDIKQIIHSYAKYKNELKKEELERNEPKKIFKINI
jgi:5'-3' exonuclease